jgi:uncharacterized protein
VFLLPPYHRNFDKRIVKSPKLYFYDTGLACALLNIHTPEQLDAHFAKGALFENMAITELLKAKFNMGQTPAFYFWQDSNKREIDLLSEEGGRLKAVEIKAGKTIARNFTRHLFSFQAVAGADAVELYLVYGGETGQRRGEVRVLAWREVGEVFG